MGSAGSYRDKVWPMLLGWKELAVVCQEPGEQVLGAATLIGSQASVPLAGLAEWVAAAWEWGGGEEQLLLGCTKAKLSSLNMALCHFPVKKR